MNATFRLTADEFNHSFVDRIRALFRGDELVITVADETPLVNPKHAKLPPGMPAENLRKFAGSFSKEDAEEMMRAIEEECERIDPEDW